MLIVHLVVVDVILSVKDNLEGGDIIKRNILKIFIIFILNLLFIKDVFAYSKIDSDYFKRFFIDKSYDIQLFEDGVTVEKLDENDDAVESYDFKEFDDDNDAIKYIKNTYEGDPYNNVSIIEDEYDKSGDFSYLIYNYTIENTSLKYYNYLFRYKNVVVLGSGDYQNKDIIKNNIDELFKDREEVYEDINNNIKKEETTLTKKDIIILITISIEIVLFIILLSAFIINKHKSNTSKKK